MKVIVPSKFKPAESEEKESPFSRNNKLRTSFKDQFAKRYNNKKDDVASVIEKIQATVSPASKQFNRQSNSSCFCLSLQSLFFNSLGKKDLEDDKKKAGKVTTPNK